MVSMKNYEAAQHEKERHPTISEVEDAAEWLGVPVSLQRKDRYAVVK